VSSISEKGSGLPHTFASGPAEGLSPQINPAKGIPFGGGSREIGDGSGIGSIPFGGGYRGAIGGGFLGGGSPTIKPSMEQIVRPFITVDSAPREADEPTPPLPGQEGAEAFISWGQASNFFFEQDAPPDDPVVSPPETPLGTPGTQVNVQPPKKSEDPKKNETPEYRYTEVHRWVKKIKVTSATDKDIYVYIYVIVEQLFTGPKGEYVRFIFSPPEDVKQ
jgi:hypothetical protein